MSGVPYHAWTHRPKAMGGTDPIEVPSGGGASVFRAEQYNNLHSAPLNDFGGAVSFDEWSNPDSAIFEDGLDGGGDLIEVKVNEPGFCVTTLSWNWDTSWTAAYSICEIDDNIDYWPPHTDLIYREVLTGNSYYTTVSRVYPPLEYTEGHVGTQVPSLRFYLGQTKGPGAKNVQAYLTVAYFPLA